MKRLLAVLAISLMALTGCDSGGGAQPAARAADDFKGAKLVVQVWGGAYENTLRENVIKPFEEKTGAQVEVVLGTAPVAQLKSEGANASVDVVHLAAAEAATGIALGVLAPFNYENMPGGANLYSEALPNVFTVVTNWGGFGLTYRTDLVETPPTAWADLWNPEFRGKVAIWEIENSGTIELLDMVARSFGSTITDESSWDQVFAKMRELKPQIAAFVSSHADLENLLTTGEAVVAVQPNGRAIRMVRSGLNVSFVAPSEGTPTMTTLVAVAKGTKQKKLAEMFVDACLAPPAQEAYAINNFYAPSNKLAQVPEDLRPFMPYSSKQVADLITIDQAALAPLRSKLVERWNKEMK